MRLFLFFLLAGLLSLPFLLRGKEREALVAIPKVEAQVEHSTDLDQGGAILASSSSETSRLAVTTDAESVPRVSPIPAVEIRPALLRGVLLDATGEPMRKSEVRILEHGGDLMGNFKTAMTDSHGLFAFKNLAPARYEIAIRARGAEAVTKLSTVTLSSGQEEFQTLFADGNRILSGAFSFSKNWGYDTEGNGVVLHLYRGYGPEEMVACGVAVTAHDEPETSGSFKFTHLQPDVYLLRVLVSEEGHHLNYEVDLTSSDQNLGPFQIEPSTELLAAR
jgi:hypothetical protein